MFFIDFKGAYNGINHELLYEKLKKRGISKGTLNMIKYYFNTIAFSPILFDIFIDDLMTKNDD